jgi:hypothetical protein
MAMRSNLTWLAARLSLARCKQRREFPLDKRRQLKSVFLNWSNIIRMIKSRRMRWAGHVARMGEKMNAYRILVGKPEGKKPLGRPRRRWEDNIKIDLER